MSYERDSYFRHQALKWDQQYPGKAASLYVKKVINYFNYKNDLATKTEKSELRNDIVFATYYPLLFLFSLRLAFFKRYPIKRIELFFIILYLASPFLTGFIFYAYSL